MIHLLFTIFCSTSIALIIKRNDARKGQPVVLLMGNYLTAAVISLLFLLLDRTATFSVQTFLFGLGLAFLFVFAFFAFTQAVKAAGTALATVSSRLSVVIPFVLSILFFSEKPGAMQLTGFGFALLTLGMFYLSLQRMGTGRLRITDGFYLFMVFAGIGLADFNMKVFQEWRPVSDKPFFLFCIFAFAFLYTTLFVRLKNLPVDKKVLIRGLGLGVPNVFSTFFLLGALSKLPGVLVYPMVNISVILLTTVGAFLIWREKLNAYGRAVLLLGMAAILLLGL